MPSLTLQLHRNKTLLRGSAAEKESYRKFFDMQRTQSMKRQKRVGHYGWLLMAAIIGAFIWLYTKDTVNKTSLSSRVAGLQTSEEGKQMVLSVTLSDGNVNV